MTTVCGREVELPDPTDNVAVVTYVRDRLLEQGKKSRKTNFLGNPACRLRGDDNCACALGWLIPDEIYQLKMESDLDSLRVRLISLGYNREVLENCQAIHDQYMIGRWEQQFNLLIAELKKEV